MAGTKDGGVKAATTHKIRYGDDYFVRIGAIGGSKCWPTKGFGSNRERARLAGRVGGFTSRKGNRPVFRTKSQQKAYERALKELSAIASAADKNRNRNRTLMEQYRAVR